MNTYLNERIGSPSLEAENLCYFEPSDVVEFKEIVRGSDVNGVKTWMRLDNDNYISSVGVDAELPIVDKGNRDSNPLYDFQTFLNKSIQNKTLLRELNYQDHIFFDPICLATKGSGVTVGVLDTPVNVDHNGFKGAVASSSIATAKAKHDHGTRMAGLIGSRSSVFGLAPECTLEELPFHDNMGDQDINLLLLQLNKLAQETRDYVLNISLSFNDPNQVRTDFEKVFNKSNVIVVAAAGSNEELTRSGIQYPANDPRVIAVGTITEDWLSENSNPSFNPEVNIILPDFDYISLIRKGDQIKKSGGLSDSSATAVVSGLIATGKSEDPNLDTTMAKSLLSANSYQLSDSKKFKYFNLLNP